MNRRKRKTYLDDDPLSSVANLFDVAMIFAIGLLVVSLTHFGVEELITQSDVTIVLGFQRCSKKHYQATQSMYDLSKH